MLCAVKFRIMNINISEIRKFKVNNEIKIGMVHGKFKDNSFIVVVKNFETGEDEDFIVHENDFVSD